MNVILLTAKHSSNEVRHKLYNQLKNHRQLGRTLVNLVIGAFWIFLILDAYTQGIELPALLSEVDLPELPWELFVPGAAIASLLASAVTFWQRKNLMNDMPLVSTTVDQWFGAGAYSQFTHRLHPTWGTILSSAILGLAGLHTTYHYNQHEWSYALSGGTLLFALFMFCAWLASCRYPPVLR